MADLQVMSPEAAYATKDNIVPQKAYTAARTLVDLADGPTHPNAENSMEDHLPSGVGIVNASMTVKGEGLVATSGV
jgi:hypothetical protein